MEQSERGEFRNVSQITVGRFNIEDRVDGIYVNGYNLETQKPGRHALGIVFMGGILIGAFIFPMTLLLIDIVCKLTGGTA